MSNAIIRKKWDFSNFSSLTQAVGRTVKLVINEFIKATLKSRSQAPVLNTKHDFHKQVKPSTSSAKRPRGLESVDKDLSKNPFFLIQDKDFILVRLSSIVERGKHCIGKVVTAIDDDVFAVQVLKKKVGRREMFFKFHTVPDVRNFKKQDIIRKLLVRSSKNDNFVFSDIKHSESVE